MRTIEALALAIEAKDQTTHTHLQRVRTYAVAVATQLNLPEGEIEALRAAALLHDIGKLAVPEQIINKPGKTFDTFAPMGPVIVTADEIEDPHHLAISLTLNGELIQNSNTSNLIFGVPQLIAFLSSVMTLTPGDIISTGTPAGVGFARKPPRWLLPGDEVAVEVEGIGRLVNPVVAET